jgi:Icc-related predicted phosphoesterase
MKLLFTSDLHGREDAYARFSELLRSGGYDVGVIAGDLMTYPSEKAIAKATGEFRHAREEASSSVEDKKSFVERAAAKHDERTLKGILERSGKVVLFVMGNDDGILGDGDAWKSDGLVVNVNMRRTTYRGLPFVGYQYTNPYVGGAFEKPEHEQERDFLALERLLDRSSVLITHGPPAGTLDLVDGGRHAGSEALRRLVDRRRPRLHLFGHIHQAFGIEGTSVNGAYPHSRKFFAIDTETLESMLVE